MLSEDDNLTLGYPFQSQPVPIVAQTRNSRSLVILKILVALSVVDDSPFSIVLVDS